MSSVDVLPPSPPATSSGSRKRSLPLSASKPTTNTPDDSPASVLESSSLGSRKKVEFSDWANIHHPSAPDASSVDTSSVKPLPASRDCQSYIKSILKPTLQDESQTPGFDGPADEKVSLIEIMESVVQQLSKNDNSESIDAYQILASAIKAYDEIPEEAVLRNKLSSITRQIRHHLHALERPDTQPTDINLVTSALKVLVILVWKPEFQLLLNDDFRSFVLDRAVGILTEHTAPKSVIVHYLHVLATQDFNSSLLNSRARASRLLEALKSLSDHVRGNGVVSERLLVYQKLLDQARPLMKSRSSLWVEHMIAALGSTVSDTRNKALALGRKACQVFPPSNSISSSVRFALDLKQENGRTLGLSLCRRLEKLAIGKDEASQVPQIWAVVLLLCNNSSTRIDHWKGLKEFFVVIQRCFNASETDLRLQANNAWNRFVYIARPHEASDSLVPMLARPVIAQLDRSAGEKSSKASHSAAMSSYCNLLYYAFRPATSHSQYNRAWNEYIVRIMRSSFFEKSSSNADTASRILMSLLWNSKTNTKIWNETRAHENRQVEPEELPTIDCKWTRGRCLPVLEILHVLFRYSSWGLQGYSEQAYVSKAWRHFLKAVKEAGSKEIKMSNETRSAIVNVFKFLTKLWRHEEGVSDADGNHELRLSREILVNISSTAVTELSLSSIMDVLEACPNAASPSLLVVIFNRVKLESNGPLNSTALFARFFELLRAVLDFQYEGAGSTTCAELCSFLESVSHIISSFPETTIEGGLEILNSSLARWLLDKEGYLSVNKSTEQEVWTERLAEALKQLVRAFVDALSHVPLRSVRVLDDCIAAAFASSHGTVVGAVVQLWNSTFGDQEGVPIGPRLTEAIKILSPFVEIKVSSSWAHGEDEFVAHMPTYDTQFETTLPATARTHSESPRDDRLPHEDNERVDPVGQDGHDLDEQPAVVDVVRRRHDDSQLDFVPIDSSPPQVTAAESQYLTDRQKEVRDRRREETAVTFADLRSSPRPHSRHSESRDCGFARRAAIMPERPATPTLADQNDNDPDPEPSPTPKSRFVRQVSELDVPSSPASVHGVVDEVHENEESISSPMPDAPDAEDGEVQLGSPNSPPVPTAPPKIAEPVPQAHDSSEASQNEEGHVPESPQVDANPENSREQAIAVSEIEDQDAIIREQTAPTVMQGPLPVEEDAEIASSLPTKPAGQTTTPPHRSSSVFNTDELEELSASQLSHDLDWSVLEGLDVPISASKSPQTFNGALHLSPTDGDTETTPVENLQSAQALQVNEMPLAGRVASTVLPIKKRKRAQSGYAEPKKRRRKSNRSQSNSSSSQASQVKQEDDGELNDCIVVDTSSDYLGSSSPVRPMDDVVDAYILSQSNMTDAGHEVSSQQLPGQLSPAKYEYLSVVGGLKRRPGRPKKSETPLKNEDIETEYNIEEIAEEEPMNDSLRSRHSRSKSRHRMSVELSAEPELPVIRTRHALVPVVEITVPTSDNVQSHNKEDRPLTPVPAADDAHHNPPQIDVVSNLRAVLSQLKTASSKVVDLRAVDELCFQIRYQAQTNAMQSTI